MSMYVYFGYMLSRSIRNVTCRSHASQNNSQNVVYNLTVSKGWASHQIISMKDTYFIMQLLYSIL